MPSRLNSNRSPGIALAQRRRVGGARVGGAGGRQKLTAQWREQFAEGPIGAMAAANEASVDSDLLALVEEAHRAERDEAAEMMAEAQQTDDDDICQEMLLALDRQMVEWHGSLDPSRLKRSWGGPYSFVWATHDEVNYEWFYIDSSGGSFQTNVLPPSTFGFAVELAMEVRFSAAARPVAPPGKSYPVARMSEPQKTALKHAVNAVITQFNPMLVMGQPPAMGQAPAMPGMGMMAGM